ncbi:MAG: glycosyltransferase family 39 protein [Geminicoccaceae bacterium]
MERSAIDFPPRETSRSRPARRRHEALDALLVLLLALAVRIAAWPWAANDSIDHTFRVWIAWRWAEDPFPLTYGVWGPLHFVMMGPLIRLFGDPIVTPVVLHIVLGALIAPLVYLFARREFESPDGALMAGVAFALYPVAVLNSLSVRAETPFTLFLALAILALARARARDLYRWPILAGLLLTLASGIRYEGWMLTPLLALVLWPRWRKMVAFLAAASLVPLVWMLSNQLIYGDPIWGITWAATHELQGMGKAGLDLQDRVGQFVTFMLRTVGGLTLPLAVLAAAGAVLTVLRRQQQVVWLVPAIGLAVLLFAAAARGALVPKLNYTETFGLLAVPFVAALMPASGSLPAVRTGVAALYGLVVVVMAALLVVGSLRDVPGLRERSAILARIPAVNPVPMRPARAELDRLVAAIAPIVASPKAGFVSDTFGFADMGYVALESRVHPTRFYFPPDTPIADLDARPADADIPLRYRSFPLIGNIPGELDQYFRRYPEGVLLLQPGSRFAAWLDYRAPGSARLRDVLLHLDPIVSVSWPKPDDPRLLGPGERPGGWGQLIAFRYAVVDPAGRGIARWRDPTLGS